MKNTLKTVALAAVLAVGASAASAVTLTFDGPGQGPGPYSEAGLMFDDNLRILPGNCPGAGRCAAINRDVTTTLSSEIAGQRFDFNQITTRLTSGGANPQFTLTTSEGGSLTITQPNATTDLTGVAGFSSVLFVQISFTGGGNARFDDIDVVLGVAPVPVPAAGGLLLAGLGALAWRRAARA